MKRLFLLLLIFLQIFFVFGAFAPESKAAVTIGTYQMITANETWDGVRAVAETLIIAPDATLTIAASANVTVNADVIVYGKLVVNGTLSMPEYTIYGNNMGWATGDPAYLQYGVIEQGGGSYINANLTIMPNEYPAPPVYFISPAAGSTVNSADVTVTGKGVPGALISIGGQSATVMSDSTFMLSLSLASGANSLVVSVTDVFQQTRSAGTYTLELSESDPDITPPEAPVLSAVFPESDYIYGRAEAGATLTASIGTASATAQDNGLFGIPITPGAPVGTPFTVSITDASGNNGPVVSSVVEERVEDAFIWPTRLVLPLGASSSITADVRPWNDNVKTYSSGIWNSSSPDVVELTEGATWREAIYEAKSLGETVITLTSQRGANASNQYVSVVSTEAYTAYNSATQAIYQLPTADLLTRRDEAQVGEARKRVETATTLGIAADYWDTFLINKLEQSEQKMRELITNVPFWPEGSALNASEITANSALLTWTPSTDHGGERAYQIVQEGTPIASVDGETTQYRVEELAANTSYIFEIQSKQWDGIWVAGPQGTIRTPSGDNTPPAAPQVDPINNMSSVLTGTAEAGAVVYVNYSPHPIMAEADGRFSIPFPAGTEVGTPVEVWAEDATGNRSETTVIHVANIVTAISLPERIHVFYTNMTSFMLEATTTPSDPTGNTYELRWSSSNSETASVTLGEIMRHGIGIAHRTGETDITVSTPDGTITASTRVVVHPAEAQGAFTQANELLSALPDSSSITKAQQSQVEAARTAVTQAKSYGGFIDSDFENYGELLATEAKLETLFTGPVWPIGSELTTTHVTENALVLNWSDAFDLVGIGGISGYRVYQGDAIVANLGPEAKSHSVISLSPSTAYTFHVEAGDLDGNWSEKLNVTVTTNEGNPTSPPYIPPVFGGGIFIPSMPVPAEESKPAVVNGSIELDVTAKGSAAGVNAEDWEQALSLMKDENSKEIVIVANGNIQVDVPARLDYPEGSMVTVKNDNSRYSLPLQLLEGGGGTVRIAMNPLSGNEGKQVENAVAAGGASMISPAVDFSVSVTSNGKTMELNNFGRTFVERSLTVDKPLDMKKTTAIRIDNGNISFVPSTMATKDSKTEVIMKRNGNSVYAVVEHEKSFNDIEGHWAQDAIEQMAAKFIIQGVSSNKFAPEQELTRAEMAALLIRSLGLDTDTSGSPFRDVSQNDWFAGSVTTAAKYGLINGFTDGTFRPNEYVTSEQAVTMIYRAMALTGKAPDLSGTANVPGASPWAAPYVEALTKAEVLNSLTDQAYAGKGYSTRAQTASLLYRMLTTIEFMKSASL